MLAVAPQFSWILPEKMFHLDQVARRTFAKINSYKLSRPFLCFMHGLEQFGDCPLQLHSGSLGPALSGLGNVFRKIENWENED